MFVITRVDSLGRQFVRVYESQLHNRVNFVLISHTIIELVLRTGLHFKFQHFLLIVGHYSPHVFIVQIEVHNFIDQLQDDHYLYTVVLGSLKQDCIYNFFGCEVILVDLFKFR